MSSKLQSQAAREASTLAFLSRQFLQGVPPIPPSVSLDGQTALVTGSNAGLGLECAGQLLALNLSHLILAVRSQARGDAAAELLRKKFPKARIEVSLVDMASHRSMVAFAKRCEDLERLDIVILNAGISRPRFERAEETKHEMTFQINYLSTALLALLLLPILKAKRAGHSPGHLALVGSDAAYWAAWEDYECKSAFDVVDNAAGFDTFEAYKVSKLLLLMFMERLSEMVPASQVIINVPNPGACRGTEFGSDNPSKLQRFMFRFVGYIIGRTVDVGARQYVDAVTVKGVESHGGFVSEGRVKPFPVVMYEQSGRTLQETLWHETLKELEFVGPSAILDALKE